MAPSGWVSVTAATAAVTASLLTACTTPIPTAVPGPLTGPTEINISDISSPPGTEVTWGAVLLENKGDTPVHVKRVRLSGSQMSDDVAQVEAIQLSVAEPYKDGIGLARGRGYEAIPAEDRLPPAHMTIPAAGTASSAVWVLVTVRAVGDGVWRSQQMTIDYEVAGASHTVITPSGLDLCVQPEEMSCEAGPPVR